MNRQKHWKLREIKIWVPLRHKPCYESPQVRRHRALRQEWSAATVFSSGRIFLGEL